MIALLSHRDEAGVAEHQVPELGQRQQGEEVHQPAGPGSPAEEREQDEHDRRPDSPKMPGSCRLVRLATHT